MNTQPWLWAKPYRVLPNESIIFARFFAPRPAQNILHIIQKIKLVLGRATYPSGLVNRHLFVAGLVRLGQSNSHGGVPGIGRRWTGHKTNKRQTKKQKKNQANHFKKIPSQTKSQGRNKFPYHFPIFLLHSYIETFSLLFTTVYNLNLKQNSHFSLHHSWNKFLFRTKHQSKYTFLQIYKAYNIIYSNEKTPK